MRLYTPDMTHPEVNEILPYLMDGVAPPTAHQRALAACGKVKAPGKWRGLPFHADLFNVTFLT